MIAVIAEAVACQDCSSRPGGQPIRPASLSGKALVPSPAYHQAQRHLGARLEIDALALVSWLHLLALRRMVHTLLCRGAGFYGRAPTWISGLDRPGVGPAPAHLRRPFETLEAAPAGELPQERGAEALSQRKGNLPREWQGESGCLDIRRNGRQEVSVSFPFAPCLCGGERAAGNALQHQCG